MIFLARRRLWLVALILALDLVLSVTVADRIVRWELEQIREAW